MNTSGMNSRWVPVFVSAVVGLAFYFFASVSDDWVHRHTSSSLIATIDEALIGAAAGLLVLVYEQRQRQNIIKKLEVIRLMNHHVRNSLQVIAFAASGSHEREQLQEAVDRIEWALREVLPGQRDDVRELLVPPRSHEPPAPQHRDIA